MYKKMFCKFSCQCKKNIVNCIFLYHIVHHYCLFFFFVLYIKALYFNFSNKDQMDTCLYLFIRDDSCFMLQNLSSHQVRGTEVMPW